MNPEQMLKATQIKAKLADLHAASEPPVATLEEPGSWAGCRSRELPHRAPIPIVAGTTPRENP